MVQGAGFGGWGEECRIRVQSTGFRVQGSGLRARGRGFRFEGLELRVRVWGFGRVEGGRTSAKSSCEKSTPRTSFGSPVILASSSPPPASSSSLSLLLGGWGGTRSGESRAAIPSRGGCTGWTWTGRGVGTGVEGSGDVPIREEVLLCFRRESETLEGEALALHPGCRAASHTRGASHGDAAEHPGLPHTNMG